MSIFLVILLIGAMIATVVALVRGVVVFLQGQTEAVKNGATGPSEAALKSNKMMQMRIFFQALAIFIVVLILLLYGQHRG